MASFLVACQSTPKFAHSIAESPLAFTSTSSQTTGRSSAISTSFSQQVTDKYRTPAKTAAVVKNNAQTSIANSQVSSEIASELTELEKKEAADWQPPSATALTQTQPAPNEEKAASTRANDSGPTTAIAKTVKIDVAPALGLKKLKTLEKSNFELSQAHDTPFIFDLPVTYNERVKTWIRYFQNEGRSTFKNWLERSARYLPTVQAQLAKSGLPQDLAYIPMIESGYVPHATSPAGAKGLWQFIAPTGKRYGLKISWWIDERRDFQKATQAAIRYMTDLYDQFHSWYLVAASYNMGENGVRRLIQRHKTSNFWQLAEKGALPQETSDYLPKIIAAMLISKAPALYGFRELEYQLPLSFDTVYVPGGTDIVNVAARLGVSEKYMKDLNPELVHGFVPEDIPRHRVRVPKGAAAELQSRSLN